MSGRDLTPPSIRAAEGRTPPLSVRGTRGDELAALYRKVADLQSELADAEARHEEVRAESASADEMVGQMLARVSEVEARLRAAQGDLGEAEARAQSAETRAGDLAAQLGAAQLDVHQLHEDLDEAKQDAEAQRAEIESLRTRLSREHEERETLHQRVAEFAQVCDERDDALLREERLETELGAVREELAMAKLQLHGVGPAPMSSVQSEGVTARAEREARAFESRRLQQELQAAHASAASANEQLRLAVESVGRMLASLEAEPLPPEEAPEEAPEEGATAPEGDEPTQIFGNVARDLALELRSKRG